MLGFFEHGEAGSEVALCFELAEDFRRFQQRLEQGMGAAVGFLSGLVGIGGGVLIVPFLYFFYAHAGWSGVELPQPLHATVAHATSLFIIVPTALAGTMTYARNRLVSWSTVLPIAVFSMIAASAGALIASRLPPDLLKIGFGTFLIFTAIQLVRGRSASAAGPQRANIVLTAVTGALVGLFSALLGVGGGLVAIPLLIYVLRLELRFVAATSLAIVAFAATAGMLTYMFTGTRDAALTGGFIGYVHVAAALPMRPGAVVAETALAEGETAGTRERTRAPTVSLGGLRLLLVEDHEPTRTALIRLLGRRGYHVMDATCLDDARVLAQANEFDLLVSDIGLPDGAGYQLMEELRQRSPIAGIALTGYGMEQDVSRSQAAGFAVHLTKPVRVEVLDAALKRVARLGPTS